MRDEWTEACRWPSGRSGGEREGQQQQQQQQRAPRQRPSDHSDTNQQAHTTTAEEGNSLALTSTGAVKSCTLDFLRANDEAG